MQRRRLETPVTKTGTHIRPFQSTVCPRRKVNPALKCRSLLLGALRIHLGLVMVWWMNAYDYPLIVRAQPFFSRLSIPDYV